MVAKIGEIELVGPVRPEPHDLAHGVHERRPAVGREAHDLVLVTVMREAEILGQRLIENAERMREVNLPIQGKGRSLAGAPRGTGEVAETVDRDNDCFVER